VPSNLIMIRVGVRRWLSLLLLCWGVVASCGCLIHNVPSFFTLRLLLGVFEAGAVPAMWWHLAQFFPPERCVRGRPGLGCRACRTLCAQTVVALLTRSLSLIPPRCAHSLTLLLTE
jgi:MFS family permease